MKSTRYQKRIQMKINQIGEDMIIPKFKHNIRTAKH